MWKWWINGQTGLGSLPGEELANKVLNSDLINVLGLIIVLLALVILIVVVAVVAMMYYSNKGLSTMATTQQGMSNANAAWAASDAKKTEAMSRTVDEMALMRQDFAASSIQVQRMAEQTSRDVKDHESKSDDRVKSILDHVTAMEGSLKGSVTDIVGEAVLTVNAATQAATIKAVEPALEALDKLHHIGDAISTRQDASMDLLRQQHDAQINFLTEQNAIHTRLLQDEITQAQQALREHLKIILEKQPDETHSPIPDPLLAVADTLPDRVGVSDGSSGAGG